jgi:hypothetical protein
MLVPWTLVILLPVAAILRSIVQSITNVLIPRAMKSMVVKPPLSAAMTTTLAPMILAILHTAANIHLTTATTTTHAPTILVTQTRDARTHLLFAMMVTPVKSTLVTPPLVV